MSKPSVSTLYAIVTELGVSVDDIFSGNGRRRLARSRGRVGAG